MSESHHSIDPSGADPALRLKFFLAVGEPNSLLAQKNLQAICSEYSQYRFDIEYIDVLENYQAALEHRVLVTPCLIVMEPPPRVMIVGTLKDKEKVISALGINMG